MQWTSTSGWKQSLPNSGNRHFHLVWSSLPKQPSSLARLQAQQEWKYLKSGFIGTCAFPSRHSQIFSPGKKLLYQLALSDAVCYFKYLRLVGVSLGVWGGLFGFCLFFPAYLLFWIFCSGWNSGLLYCLPNAAQLSTFRSYKTKIYYQESKMTWAIYPAEIQN